MHAKRFFFALLTLVSLALSLPKADAALGPIHVDVALILSIDVSASITRERWGLEKNGYKKAFQDKNVIRAIASGGWGAVAVTVVEWAGVYEQTQIIPWTVLRDEADADKFAAQLERMERLYGNYKFASKGTAIAPAINYSVDLFNTSGVVAERRVIDVSGDGRGNVPISVEASTVLVKQARDRAVENKITINGLPILGDLSELSLDKYYEANVIGGPGAFMVVAMNFEDFAQAIIQKLVQEIAINKPKTKRPLFGAAFIYI